ncbi:MAG TPA: hypothetical protein EYQ64_11430 [Gemmatimonadetes bacterium]|nr:hypothetical protein [Gemmatimonadota bacterium]
MGEGKSKNLTRAQFEEVMKRASEFALSDPYDGSSSLDEAEVLRIASEVGLPDKHVRRALAEVRSNEPPSGVVDRWFGSAQVRGSRVVSGSKEDVQDKLDHFLVAGNLLEAIRQGPDLLLYRPAVDWISNFARAGASMSRRVHWAAAKEIEIHLEEIDEDSTLVEIRVDPDIRGSYTTGAAVASVVLGGSWAFGFAVLASSWFSLPTLALVSVGGVTATGIAAVTARITGHYSRRAREEVQQELEGVLDRLEQEEDLTPPPASWRRWVMDQARRFRVEITGSRGDD